MAVSTALYFTWFWWQPDGKLGFLWYWMDSGVCFGVIYLAYCRHTVKMISSEQVLMPWSLRALSHTSWKCTLKASSTWNLGISSHLMRSERHCTITVLLLKHVGGASSAIFVLVVLSLLVTLTIISLRGREAIVVDLWSQILENVIITRLYPHTLLGFLCKPIWISRITCLANPC